VLFRSPKRCRRLSARGGAEIAELRIVAENPRIDFQELFGLLAKLRGVGSLPSHSKTRVVFKFFLRASSALQRQIQSARQDHPTTSKSGARHRVHTPQFQPAAKPFAHAADATLSAENGLFEFSCSSKEKAHSSRGKDT